MRWAVTGSSGLIGSEVVRVLRARGHEVTRIVRSLHKVPPSEHPIVWHPREGVIEAARLEDHDVVLHLAGESIAGVWTAGKKRRIRESRELGTTLLARTLAGLRSKPRVLFSASGFTIYGERPPSEVVTESSAVGTGFLPEVARIWEAATRPAEDAGIRVVHTRFGNVLASHGGMLEVLIPFFRMGLGTRFGSGDQMWPWIALPEIPRVLLFLLDRPEIAGPVNVVAPEAVTNAEFTRALAAALGRPSVLSVPDFLLKLAPGHMGEELLLWGARVVPERLLDAGYQFQWPRLEPTLRELFSEGEPDRVAGPRRRG